MWSCVCLICNMTTCKLMEESAIKGLPCHCSICPSQLKYQMKNFWLKASVLYEQLLSSAPYVTLCPIRNGMFMVSAHWTIHQLLSGLEKLGFLVHESPCSSKQVQENVLRFVILCFSWPYEEHIFTSSLSKGKYWNRFKYSCIQRFFLPPTV